MNPLDHTPVFSGPKDLEDLTLQALATPSLDAWTAVEVLADALLERALIRCPVIRKNGRAGRQFERSARRSVCIAAVKWARWQSWTPKWMLERQGLTKRLNVGSGEQIYIPQNGRITKVQFFQHGRLTTLPPASFGASVSITRRGVPVDPTNLRAGDVLRLDSVAPPGTPQTLVVEYEAD